MQQRVLLSIGSNLSDRIKNCRNAIERLNRTEDVRVVRCSSFYETSPWGRKAQPDFVNCAVELLTGLSPWQMLGLVKSIEKELGRTEGERWSPRPIDLDIILWEDKIIDHEKLKVPHPLMQKRRFVLVPLAEIAPDWIDPLTGKTIRELLKACKDTEKTRKVSNP